MNKLYVAVGSLVITTIVMSHNSYDSLTAALLGAGTTINPYRIENCMDLQSMRQDPKAHYLLTKDIECNESVRWNTSSCLDNKTAETCSMQKDKCFWNKKYTCKGEMYDGCAYGKFDCLEWCDGSDWIGEDTCEDMYGFVPIGTKDNPFSGSLDGSGYTISNLDSYWPDTNNVGLFGVVNGGTIKNLRYIRSKISGQSYVGGMVGLFKGGIIENVISEFGVIEGDNRVGGLIGGVVLEGISADVSKIASYNCTVDGRTFVGGLVGENRDGIISESATSECNVSGSYDVGGLIGVNVGGEINNTYSNAKIGTGTRVGGSLGVNAGNGEVINAVSFGPVNCEFCDFNKTGGLIAYNESGSIVKSSYYNGDDNNKNDSGYGEAKTLNELSESGTYVAWDWDSVWGKDEGGNPFLVGLSRSSTALSDIDSEHASAESEENINIGETIIGMVYKIVNNKSEPVKDVTIAISVNGEPIKVRGESDEEGKFSIEGVNSSSGDLVTVFIERDNNQAATIAKKTDENLPSIDLYYNQLRINGSQPQMIFSNEISRLEYTGEYVHPDLESLFISKDKEILVREGKTLYVESGATFRLTNNLEVGNLELEGMILQKGYDLTVIDKFIQKGGIYDAGAGITLVKGDFVMDGGDFNGDKGLVEFAGDLVGMFRLNGGKFVSPSMLIVSTDWIQNGGEFIHNESTVVFAGTSHNIDVNESETFFNVVIDKKDNSGLRIIKDDKIKVLNDLTLIDGILEGGKIEAEGAVVHKSFFDGGDTIMEIKGDRNRSVVFSVGGRLPQVIFNAKSATARVEVMHTDDDDNEEDDVLIFDKPFNLINGNININEGDVWFNSDVDMEGGYIKMQGGSIVSAAPFRFYDGKITANYGAITFNSPLLLSGGEILLLDAELSVNNDTLIKNGKFRGGNGNVAFNGNLIMTGGTLIAPSGLMTVRGNMSLLKDKASFDNNGGTVSFEGMTRTIDMDGAKFGNLIIRKNPDEYLLLESGTTIIAEGNVDIERGALRDESIDVYGNMNMGPAAGTGSTSFEFKGTRPQTISLEHPTRFRGNITVNKTGDKYLRLESDINMTRKTQSIKVKSGGLDLNMHDIEFVPKAGLIVYKNGILLFRGREKHPVPTLYKESTVHYILERGPEVLDDVNYYNLILDSTRPLTFKPSDKGLTVFRDLTLRGGTLEADKNQTINIEGSWLKRGGNFTPGNGTVIFSGEANVMEGENMFFNLTKQKGNSVLVMEAGAKQRVSGTLILEGSGCDLLQIRPIQRGETMKLEVFGSKNISSADIRGVIYEGKVDLECSNECIDHGNNENIEFTSQQCSINSSYCGDNKVDNDEKCDDGNNVSGDGCSGLCIVEEGFGCKGDPSVCSAKCGDKLIRGDETCDDGKKDDKTISGDGCSKTCKIEKGYACSGEPSKCLTICGDGLVNGDEECDDKNTKGGDGCSQFCIKEYGYSCNDKEPSFCKVICGNGKKGKGEFCDDGNSKNNDGCSKYCTIEMGFNCEEKVEGGVSVCEGR